MTKTLCKHNRHVAAVSPLCRRSPRSFEDALDVLDGNPASVLRGVVVILVSHLFTGLPYICLARSASRDEQIARRETGEVELKRTRSGEVHFQGRRR